MMALFAQSLKLMRFLLQRVELTCNPSPFQALACDRSRVIREEDIASWNAYQGDFAAALAFYEQSLAVAREFYDDWLCAYCLEGWACVVAKQGKCAWAARLWGAAESLRERCGIPLYPLDRMDYEPAVVAARTMLGEQAFTTAWAEGRTMTFEQALSASE